MNPAFKNQLFPGERLEILRDFGPQPVSSRFPLRPFDDEFSMPMTLGVCPRSGLVQLANTFPAHELCPRVPWLTAFEPEGHLDDFAVKLANLPGLSRNDWIAGYSSKDDSLIRRLAEMGFRKHWRLDPVEDLGITDACAFVETFQLPFQDGLASRAVRRAGKPKLFLIRHVLEHSYDLRSFLSAARDLVAPDGYVVFEVPDCTRALEAPDYTTLWEEHSLYFTPQTLHTALKNCGLAPVLFETHPHPFENCMLAVCRPTVRESECPITTSTVAEIERARKFSAQFEIVTREIQNCLQRCKDEGLSLALFGAGHLAVAFTSLHRVSHYFNFVIDDNPHKCGRHLAGSGLQIRPSTALVDDHVDICLLALNPEHEEKILAKNHAFKAHGGRFGSIFPSSKRNFFN